LQLEEVGLGGMDWIDLNQDVDSLWELVNLVMKFQVPENAGSSLTCCEPVSFPRRTLLHVVTSDGLCSNS
jgi:hypothetical protein